MGGNRLGFQVQCSEDGFQVSGSCTTERECGRTSSNTGCLVEDNLYVVLAGLGG